MSGSDWEYLARMTDEEAWQNAMDDPDNPPLTEEQLANFVRAKAIPGATSAEKYAYLKKMRPCTQE